MNTGPKMTQRYPSPEIYELLLHLGYRDASIQNIIDELYNLFEDIGFYELQQEARAAIDTKDQVCFINTLKELMKLLENKGIYRPDYPTGLIKLLVNGLNSRGEDIFAIIDNSGIFHEEKRKEQEFLASCAAITQLGYILLYQFVPEVRSASSGPHVFIVICGSTPFSMIFVDFSIGSIMEIDDRQYDLKENNYYLKNQVSDDETSRHIAQYYSIFHVTSGIGLSHNIHNNIGIAYDRVKMHENAFEEFNEALRLDPGYIEVLNNLAVTYYRMGLVDEAIDRLKEAVRLRPEYPEAHCNLGNIYSSDGRYEEALTEF